jgi:hypothetical protein
MQYANFQDVLSGVVYQQRDNVLLPATYCQN